MVPLKFLVCALFYGDFPVLAQRCARTLRALQDTGAVDLRIGLNEVSARSLALIDELLPGVDRITASPQIYKYPMMRRLVHEYTGDATHLMWFDDDSCLVPGLDVPGWLAAVARHARVAQGTLGAAYLREQSAAEHDWIRAQPWYRGRPLPVATRFNTGGWFVVPLALLRRFDWPPAGLRHNGGDVALGALLYQQGLEVMDGRGGVAINADESLAESSAARRGFSEPALGVGDSAGHAEPDPRGPVVGVVGLGHVGSALAAALQPRLRVLRSDPALPGSATVAELARACDVILVCVPTPARPSGAADIDHVEQVVQAIATACADRPTPPVTVIRSTVPPGTTQALAHLHPRLPLVVSPEFLRQHAAAADLAAASRILIGLPTPAPAEAVLTALEPVWRAMSPLATVVMTDAATAELAKYATNAFLALKVTYANQLADACAALGLDYAALAEALVLDPRVGPSHLAVPGHDGQPGFGGPCLPKDLSALLALAGPSLPLLEATARYNAARRGASLPPSNGNP
ncbi:MAG: UDP-glucose/GDP-mannose dehydrogenase family protein [Ramlibacter sp.]|nr:UDP-glucose/GDP-mannose dehydrogenase family protein [Ramlibacter sp.]